MDSNFFMFLGILTFKRLEQSEKHPNPKYLTLSGNFISFKFLQYMNAPSPISWTPSGILIVFKFSHFAKALLPILVTIEGMLIVSISFLP